MLFERPRFRALWSFVVCVASLLATATSIQAQTGSAPGGFVASATDSGLRPRLSTGEIQALLPQRGAFTFPAPYGTTGVRLTNGSDCGGTDCVLPVGYSYWNNINNHVGSDTMLVFLGLDRNKGGGGPTLFSYNKKTGETRNAGALFTPDSPYSWSTGEGWYFSATRPTSLYMNDGPRMLRYDVVAHTFETVYDVRDQLGSDKYIWQMHSSNDDRVHSATVRQSSTYEMLGCMAYQENIGKTTYIPAKGDYDECQIDKSGRWLLIKENVDGRNGEDNVIIDLQTGTQEIFLDEDGAAGHSDMGFGYLVAEDNFAAQPGAVRVWQLGVDPKAQSQGTLIYEITSWASGVGHITYGDARPGVPVGQQMACSSDASRDNLPRVNEIVCYRLDGSLNVLVVAPNMTDLNASGGGSDDYWKMPKGNLDVTGEYFIWTANGGTNRNDAFIVRIPTQKLPVGATSSAPQPIQPPSAGTTPGTSPAPAPAPSPAPPVAATPPPSGSTSGGGTANAVQWMSLINITASGSSVQKTGGCGGCPDAIATSEQQVGADGSGLRFTVPDVAALRYVGLGTGSLTGAPTDLPFALRLQGGTAEVREGGTYRSETSFAAGDTLSIAVGGTTVTYAKNGDVFYTSANPVSGALRVQAFLYDLQATVSNVMVTTGTAAKVASTAAAATSIADAGTAGPAAATSRYAVPRTTPLVRRVRNARF